MIARRLPLFGLFLGLILSVSVSTGLARSRQVPATPDSLAARVEAKLARHLDGTRIAAWLETLAPSSLELRAARWILAWLPLSDLVDLDRDLLREHVELATATYRDSPWQAQVDETLWLRYVVPHRVSQEPAQAWRRVFWEALWPHVSECRSMESAALAVNRWCREQATFISTSGRDMGPLTTLKRGQGRCEEEMILCISALRSVGLPARACATPYWAHTDNNHAWVEVWADGDWHYLGACEPDRCLDRAWFTAAARRAGFVRSVAYGEFRPEGEDFYRHEAGATLVNSTAVYTTPFRLTVHVAEGSAVTGDDGSAVIHVNVFNFGSLRPIASLDPGGTLDLGPGEYAVTAELEGRFCLQVLRGRPGEVLKTTLDLNDAYDLSASPGFWLRYPEEEAGPQRDLDLVNEQQAARHRARLRARDTDRAKLRQLSTDEAALLDTLDEETRLRVTAILDKPMERASSVFLLLDHYPEGVDKGKEGRAACLDFLTAADDKDLLELSVADMRGHIDSALAVRHRLEPLGLVLPDSIFREALLPARIAREPGANWRQDLPRLSLAAQLEPSLMRILARHHETLALAPLGFLGAPLDPGRCWRLGLGTETDLGVALVGLLRRNGFPARFRHERVEVWMGDWRRLDPVAGSYWRQERGAGARLAGPGRLDIRITRGGVDYPQAESYREFNVSRLAGGAFSSPWWDPVQGEQEWDAGDYLLGAGTRLPNGSVHARLRAFRVDPGQTCRVTLPAEIGAGHWDVQGTLFSGPEPEAVLAALALVAPRDGEDRDLPPGGLFLLFEAGEPADRMIAALARVQARLANLGLPLVPVLIGESDPSPWCEKLAAAGYAPHLWRDPQGKLDQIVEEGQDFSPLVMLKRSERVVPGTLMLRQGFDAAIDAAVHLALDRLEAGP